LKYWEALPPVFTTSSESAFGKEKVLNYIGEIIQAVESQK
jgi:GTP-binding protein